MESSQRRFDFQRVGGETGVQCKTVSIVAGEEKAMNYRKPSSQDLSSHASHRNAGRLVARAAGMSLMALLLTAVAAATDQPGKSHLAAGLHRHPRRRGANHDSADSLLHGRAGSREGGRRVADCAAARQGEQLVAAARRDPHLRPERSRVFRPDDPAPAVAHRRDGLSESRDRPERVEGGRRPASRACASSPRCRNTAGDTSRSVRNSHALPGVPVPEKSARWRPSWLPALPTTAIGKGLPRRKVPRPFRSGPIAGGSCGRDHPAATAPCGRFTCRASMIFVDPGVEGLEWFVGSDPVAMGLGSSRCTAAAGQGQLASSEMPARPRPVSAGRLAADGIRVTSAVAVAGQTSPSTSIWPSRCRDAHAHRPWPHTPFNPQPRARGFRRRRCRPQWAVKGIQTRPLPQRRRLPTATACSGAMRSTRPTPTWTAYDKVLTDCRRGGHPHGDLFLEQGAASRAPRSSSEHGDQLGAEEPQRRPAAQFLPARPRVRCPDVPPLRLARVPEVFDRPRVSRGHPLDGVYYDWNVALALLQPAARGGRPNFRGR